METYRTDFAVAVLAITPDWEIPLVRDPSKLPSFWKLAGGRNKPKLMEDPIDCGLRELFEETGITGERKSSKIIYSEVRDDHTFYIIFVEIPSLKGLEKVGDEGEEVRVFSEEEVLRMKLLYSHEEVVKSSIIALKDERRMEVQRT